MKDLGVRLDVIEFKFISSEDKLSLIGIFSEKEIRDVVWQCEDSKIPRPDGFNFNFIKKS